MGVKNLFYQFNSSIQYIPNFDKHSDKFNSNSDSSAVVKSLTVKNNLKDFSHQFCDFMKTNYPDIKKVRNITSDHCQAFIDSKYKTCTIKTLECYQSNFRKLEKCVRSTFGCSVNYQTEVKKDLVVKTESVKQYSLTDKELLKVFDTSRKSEGYKFARFTYFTGTRVNSCSKLLSRDLLVSDNFIKISIHNDKGGRDRIITITSDDSRFKEFREFAKDLKKYKNPTDRLFNCTAKNADKWIERRCKKLGIKTPTGQFKSGNHSIRKNFAEHRYKTTKDIGQTMIELGHGRDRKDLEDTYLHSKK